MSVHVYVFLLVVCLFLSLALLWHLSWFHLRPSSSRGGAKRSTLPRSLCPAAQTIAPPVVSPPLPRRVQGQRLWMSRPWPEVKSRRGAPKRIDTAGFACPNQQCPYFGITDAHIHAAFRRWQARSGRTHPDVSRPCLPHHVYCTTPHALVPSEDPLAADRRGARLGWPKGWIFRRSRGSQGYRQATITTWLTRAGEHAQTLHEHCFRNLHLPHLQLDELRTRLRNTKQVLWLWLAIDPTTKLLPVLHIGLRTQNMAHPVIHSLRELLAPGCIPIFTSDGLNVYFYALTAHFGTWREERRRGHTAPVAGGSRSDLWPGEEKLIFGAS